ncbi:MAG: DPP IV N-terminal domain-containing protein, partial [Lysobacteraceae bacterium]
MTFGAATPDARLLGLPVDPNGRPPMRVQKVLLLAPVSLLLAASGAHAQSANASGTTASDPITIEQAMADPDWIGSPINTAWWSWDGKRAYFPLKRSGSSLDDLYAVDVAGGKPMAKIANNERAAIDASNPAYDSAHRRSVFVRNGDIFVRDLQSGALTQLTRSDEHESNPGFIAGDVGVDWQSGNTWYRYRFDQRLVETVAVLKAEKDPAAADKPDAFRDMQLRLIDTLRREKQERDDHKAQVIALRQADPTRASAPIYLGNDIAILYSALSPDGRWLVAAVAPKDADVGRIGKLQKFVTESGYEEQEDERTRVGRNTPVGQSLKLVDLRDGSVADLKYDGLPGIDADPLAALRKVAGKDPLKGHRPVRVDGIQWSNDGAQLAVELHAMDNKDRWIATTDFATKTLRRAHRLTDPAWINSFAFNDFGWLPDPGNDQRPTLWFLSEQSGYAHLYTLAPGGAARERTHGNWETSSPQFSTDGRHAWF